MEMLQQLPFRLEGCELLFESIDRSENRFTILASRHPLWQPREYGPVLVGGALSQTRCHVCAQFAQVLAVIGPQAHDHNKTPVAIEAALGLGRPAHQIFLAST